ncbi:MAG: VWA domain-containing protein, partial [Acidobacteriota bacterium]
FKVFDNGKQQAITVFREVVNRPPAISPAPLPVDTFSNLQERSGEVAPSVTVILLDALNTPAGDQSYAREQVVRFLERLQPNDRVAIYVLSSRLRILHDFTSDIAPLLKAVRDYPGEIETQLHAMVRMAKVVPGTGLTEQGSGGNVANAAGPTGNMEAELGNAAVSPGVASVAAQVGAANAAMRHQRQVERDAYTAQRVKLTSDALIAIANHMAGLPGRKNLVWISGGFPMWGSLERGLHPNSPDHSAGEQHPHNAWVARTVQALNNVNLAIYPVDARGLMASSNVKSAHENVVTGDFNLISNGVTAMKALARHTGGRAIYDTNDIAGSIRRVVENSKVTYVLAYYPQNVQWNGEYRKITVRVDRPGLSLQYRHGYAALSGKEQAAANGNAVLQAAVASPLDATGVGFTVRMFPEGHEKSAARGPFFMHFLVDMHDVTFTERKGHWDGKLTLVTDELGPQGQTLNTVSLAINFHLKPKTYKRYLSKGLGFRERVPFAILPNAVRLRIVLRDDPTGAIGSLSVPLARVMRRQG